MKFYLLTFFLFTAVLSNAQNSSIAGRVVDSVDSSPLEYASVALYTMGDTSLVTGVVTSPAGNFKLEKMNPGQYFIRIQFLGYQRKQTDNFILASGQDLELGDILLVPGQQLVGEVNVTGNRINTMNKVDKQTYKADQFESARGGSAIDVLKNMPSVAVNGEGEITVRGSSGFLVLIDGKPVLTDARTALSQLPANAVDNVELITTPSAKYDPDGKAGIVNITTKRGTNNGTGLLIDANYGLPGTTDFGNIRVAKRYGGDVTFNYMKDKWDISLGGNYTRNDLAGYREGNVWTKSVVNNTINLFPSKGERSFNRYDYAARASVGFAADKNNVFSLGLFSGERYQQRDANLFYTNSQVTLDSNVKIYDAPYYNANNQIKQGTFTLGNFDYTHIFADKSSLTASLLYEYDDLHGTTHNHNLTKPGGDVIQYVQNPYRKPINGYRFKLDHSISIGGGTLESGYQFRADSQDGHFDYIVTPFDPNQPELERFSGTAISRNLINSVYTQFSANHNKLQYIAGLRYEYSKRTVKLSFDPNTHLLKLSNLFPSFNLLYAIAPALKLKAGYSRRIQRSTNNMLNPIPEREHSETLETGDPDLLPEFVNLGEIGLTQTFKDGGSLFLTAYFQVSKDPVQRVNSIYADTILNRVYTNVAKGSEFGFETGADLHPVKWWALYFGANVFRQSYKGTFQIVDSPLVPIDNSGWVYSINANTTFNFSPAWSLQGNVNYLSKRPTAQGEDSRFLIPNMSLKKSFFNKRLSASVQWQNIDLGMHQSNRQRITTWGEDFYTTTNYIYETDIIMINLSYNLNNRRGKTKLPSSEFGEKEF